jgi:hypothetical protein
MRGAGRPLLASAVSAAAAAAAGIVRALKTAFARLQTQEASTRIAFFREVDFSFFLSKQTYLPAMVRRGKVHGGRRHGARRMIEDIIDHGDHSSFSPRLLISLAIPA